MTDMSNDDLVDPKDMQAFVAPSRHGRRVPQHRDGVQDFVAPGELEGDDDE